MFCDEVIAHYPNGSEGRALLNQAHRFVLTPEFISVADRLGKINKDCLALKHLFRLPHDIVWMEPRPMDFGDCGTLLQQLSAKECADLEIIIGTEGIGSITNAIRVIQISTVPRPVYSWIALPDTLRLTESGTLKMRIGHYGDNLGNHMPDKAMVDWMVFESIRYCCYLAALNSRNLIEIESTDLNRLNSARVKRGRLPLLEYKLVHIRADIRRMMREAERADAEEKTTGVRAHWRRGHFKVRKSGMFWWSPHMAGHTELGQIEKSYVA